MSGTYDLVVLANRLPVRRLEGARWATSPGGLVSAVFPILQRERDEGRGGAWIGWSGSREESFEPFDHEGVLNVPVNLDDETVSAHYDGMSNGTLWPLYHDAVRPPTFRRRWWWAYAAVNRRFAAEAVERASEGALVWVHDYHLHLVPGLIREARPDVRIGYFLHIPFPGYRLFSQLPWRREILRGTLGSDVAGFQTADDAENFISAADRYTAGQRAEGEPSRGGGRVSFEGRTVEARAFPISIDAKRMDEIARSEPVRRLAAEHRERIGDRRILLGVDRMDYTKGIVLRLRAFQELLRSGRVSPEDAVLIQSCVPSREQVEAYTDLRSEIEEMVGQINGEFGSVGVGPVQYLRQSLPHEELVALYLAADVMMVTPVRDGMNLIAKEYVASRTEEDGALVLSECTGAANELREALIVNPHDLDGIVGALHAGIRMDRDEQRQRMRAMRQRVFENDVYAWADGFMRALRGEGERPGPRTRVSGGSQARAGGSLG